MIQKLFIDGTKVKARYRIIIDDVEKLITHKTLTYLVRLAHARLTSDGWVYKTDLDMGDVAKYMQRVRNEISPLSIENDVQGSYRLDIDASKIEMNRPILQEIPDFMISNCFKDD